MPACLAGIRQLIQGRLSRFVIGYLLNSPYGLSSERSVFSSCAELLRSMRDRGVMSERLYLNMITLQEKCETHPLSGLIASSAQKTFPSPITGATEDRWQDDCWKADLLAQAENTLEEMDAHTSALLLMLKHDAWLSPQNRQRH